MDLYIPISSLNFNKIISSESISPSMYYEKHNFGDKRFTRISSIDINGEYVLAFTKAIGFMIEEGEIEEYPINIRIPKDLLCHADCLNEIEINNYITCYLISRTIHFKEGKAEFIFRNLNEGCHVKSNVTRSSRTKFIDKYHTETVENTFIYLTRQDLLTLTQHIKTLPKGVHSGEIDNNINIDRKVNSIKGFLYCYLIGHLYSLPEGTEEILNNIKSIKNKFSAYINNLQIKSGKTCSNDKDFDNYVKPIANIVDDIIPKIKKQSETIREEPSIDDQVNEFINNDKNDLYGKFEKEFVNLTKIYFENNDNYSDNITEPITKVLKSLTPSHNKDKIRNTFINHEETTEARLLKIKLIVERLFSCPNRFINFKNNSDKHEIDRLCDTVTNDLEKYSYLSINPPGLDSIKLSDNLKFESIDNLELTSLDRYCDIVNYLFDNNMSTSEGIHKSKEKIIIDNAIRWDLPEDSDDRKILHDLIYEIQGKDKFAKVLPTTDPVIAGLIYFIRNCDDLDKLFESLRSNTVSNKFISVSFWGAFNGITSLHKKYTSKNNIFKKYCADIKYIDNIIAGYLSKEYFSPILQTELEADSSKLENHESEPTVSPNSAVSAESQRAEDKPDNAKNTVADKEADEGITADSEGVDSEPVDNTTEGTDEIITPQAKTDTREKEEVGPDASQQPEPGTPSEISEEAINKQYELDLEPK